jgi:MFS family permease
MLPGAVVALLAGPLAGRLVGALGARAVLLVADVIGAAGLAGLAFAHQAKAEVIIWLIIANAAIAMAYASMPALLVTYIDRHETGIASSINSIMRTVGGAIGSAVVITILASLTAAHRTPAGTLSLPTEGAFRMAFILGAAFFTLSAVLVAAFLPRRASHALTATQIAEEEALGAAGEFSPSSISLDD